MSRKVVGCRCLQSDGCLIAVLALCEQEMMQAKSYPDYPAHKKAHDDFVAKVGGLSCPIDDATVHFAKDWSVIRDCVIFRLTSNSVHFHSLLALTLFVGRRED